MKILIIFSECLVAAALTVYSISDPWFHSPVGYFLLLMIFSALFFGFFTYGTANALKRMGKEKSRSYELGIQAGGNGYGEGD